MKKTYTLSNLLLQNKKIILSLSIFLTVLFSYIAVFNVKNVNIKSWEGYYLLLVERNIDNDNSIYVKLQNSGFFNQIISEYNTEVAYSNYNSLSYITVDKLEKRFNSKDPRMDNFIKKIGGYFKAYSGENTYSVYYLKTDAGYKETKNIINSILESNSKWIMPRYENYQLNIIFFFLYIAILFFFIYSNRKKWIIYLLHTVPWIFLIYLNGKSYFFIAFFMLFILRLLLLIEEKAIKEYNNNNTISLQKYFNKNTILILIITIFSFVFPLIFSKEEPGFFITPISILLFELFFVISHILFTYYKVLGYSHRIFYAVKIKKEKSSKTIFTLEIKSFALIYFLSIISLPLYFTGHFARIGNKDLKYPVPVNIYKYPESGITLDFLNKIASGNENNNCLPDYCEYIRHLSYQIRLPFKADYSIPLNNENITISNYYLEKNNYKKEKIIVNQFTDTWLNDNITIDKGRGITSLMLSDTGLIQAETGSIVPAVPLFIIPLVFDFLYPIIFYFLFDIKKSQIYENGKNIIPVIRRRKQQAA